MFNENFNPNLTELYEIKLNQAQLKNIAHLLPEGFTLERDSHLHHQTPLTSKKHSINDLNSVNRALDLDFETSSNADTNTKRILRDHSKKKMIDTPTLEPEPIPVPPPKVDKGPNEGVKKCINVIQKLKRLSASGPFREPVDVVGLGLTDYYSVIKEPMDLRTVEEKLRSEQYGNTDQFAADIRKIWSNAYRYNPKGTHVHNLATEMSAAFERYFKEIEHISLNDTVRELEKKVEKLSKQITELHSKGAQVGTSSSKNHKPSSVANPNVRGYTLEEKKVLCQNIKKLAPEFLRGVWEIVSEGLQQNAKNKEILEFDIQTLPFRVVRELDKYVKLKMSQTSKNKSKTNKKDQPIKQVISSSIHQKLNGTGPKEIGEAYQQSIQLPYSDSLPERKASLQTQQMEEEAAPPTAHDDAQSGSSESSFISDSDSDSDGDK